MFCLDFFVTSNPSTVAFHRTARHTGCARASFAKPPPDEEWRKRVSSSMEEGICLPTVSIGSRRRQTTQSTQAAVHAQCERQRDVDEVLRNEGRQQ